MQTPTTWLRTFCSRVLLICACCWPVACTPPQETPPEGQIIPNSAHPQWLARQGGAPFFMAGPGDPEDFLYRGALNSDGTRDGDQMDLIRKLADSGANCIYMQAIRSHGGDGDETHNPFVNHDPAAGLNETVLAQWDTWFAEMDRQNIVIYFFFYDDGARLVDRHAPVADLERRMVQSLVSRFTVYRNLIWCVAEEYQEAFTPEGVRTFADAIRAADTRRHPIAVHKLHGLDFSEFSDSPSIDQFAIQYNVGTADSLHQGVVAARASAVGRYNLNLSEAKGFGTGLELRRKLWAAAMGGAYVMVLDMDIATTPAADLAACGHLVRFFESTRFQTMQPRDDLRYADTEYVLGFADQAFILYGSRRARYLGILSLPHGIYNLHWFDCATGRREEQPAVHLSGGDTAWPVPRSFGEDVALYIEDAGIPDQYE